MDEAGNVGQPALCFKSSFKFGEERVEKGSLLVLFRLAVVAVAEVIAHSDVEPTGARSCNSFLFRDTADPLGYE